MTHLNIDPPGYSKSAAQDRPSTPFEQARDDQVSAIITLDELITQLGMRLGPVLGPEKLCKADTDKEQQVSTDAALVLVMRHHTHRIQDSNERLSALLARLCI